MRAFLCFCLSLIYVYDYFMILSCLLVIVKCVCVFTCLTRFYVYCSGLPVRAFAAANNKDNSATTTTTTTTTTTNNNNTSSSYCLYLICLISCLVSCVYVFVWIYSFYSYSCVIVLACQCVPSSRRCA